MLVHQIGSFIGAVESQIVHNSGAGLFIKGRRGRKEEEENNNSLRYLISLNRDMVSSSSIFVCVFVLEGQLVRSQC